MDGLSPCSRCTLLLNRRPFFWSPFNLSNHLLSPFICRFIHPSIHHPNIHPSDHPSVHPTYHLSVHLMMMMMIASPFIRSSRIVQYVLSNRQNPRVDIWSFIIRYSFVINCSSKLISTDWELRRLIEPLIDLIYDLREVDWSRLIESIDLNWKRENHAPITSLSLTLPFS